MLNVSPNADITIIPYRLYVKRVTKGVDTFGGGDAIHDDLICTGTESAVSSDVFCILLE